MIASVPVLFEQPTQEESQPTVNVPHLYVEQLANQLQPEVKAKLQEELHAFRLSLSGSGRTFVGSTSFSSGMSIKLIEQIVENATCTSLTSVECIEDRLPVFNLEDAEAIWSILVKYI